MSDSEVAGMIDQLDTSIRNDSELQQSRTVVGGLYAIVAELAELTKEIKRITSPEPFRGAR